MKNSTAAFRARLYITKQFVRIFNFFLGHFIIFDPEIASKIRPQTNVCFTSVIVKPNPVKRTSGQLPPADPLGGASGAPPHQPGKGVPRPKNWLDPGSWLLMHPGILLWLELPVPTNPFVANIPYVVFTRDICLRGYLCGRQSRSLPEAERAQRLGVAPLFWHRQK